MFAETSTHVEVLIGFYSDETHSTRSDPTSYKYGCNSIEKVISYNPSYPFIGTFIWVITPLITGRGEPCRNLMYQES